MTEPLLTPEEVAEMLGISETTLKRWRLDGEGPPAVFLSPRTIRYSPEAVAEWMAEQEAPTPHQRGTIAQAEGLNRR